MVTETELGDDAENNIAFDSADNNKNKVYNANSLNDVFELACCRNTLYCHTVVKKTCHEILAYIFAKY